MSSTTPTTTSLSRKNSLRPSTAAAKALFNATVKGHRIISTLDPVLLHDEDDGGSTTNTREVAAASAIGFTSTTNASFSLEGRIQEAIGRGIQRERRSLFAQRHGGGEADEREALLAQLAADSTKKKKAEDRSESKEENDDSTIDVDVTVEVDLKAPTRHVAIYNTLLSTVVSSVGGDPIDNETCTDTNERKNHSDTVQQPQIPLAQLLVSCGILACNSLVALLPAAPLLPHYLLHGVLFPLLHTLVIVPFLADVPRSVFQELQRDSPLQWLLFKAHRMSWSVENVVIVSLCFLALECVGRVGVPCLLRSLGGKGRKSKRNVELAKAQRAHTFNELRSFAVYLLMLCLVLLGAATFFNQPGGFFFSSSHQQGPIDRNTGGSTTPPILLAYHLLDFLFGLAEKLERLMTQPSDQYRRAERRQRYDENVKAAREDPIAGTLPRHQLQWQLNKNIQLRKTVKESLWPDALRLTPTNGKLYHHTRLVRVIECALVVGSDGDTREAIQRPTSPSSSFREYLLVLEYAVCLVLEVWMWVWLGILPATFSASRVRRVLLSGFLVGFAKNSNASDSCSSALATHFAVPQHNGPTWFLLDLLLQPPQTADGANGQKAPKEEEANRSYPLGQGVTVRKLSKTDEKNEDLRYYSVLRITCNVLHQLPAAGVRAMRRMVYEQRKAHHGTGV